MTPPTIREVASELGCDPDEVMEHLGQLLREGALTDVVDQVHFLDWCDETWDRDPTGVRASIQSRAAKLRSETLKTIG